jgi:hypothetical protein
MPFFHVENLATSKLFLGIQPWEFVITADIPKEVRSSKDARQKWYTTPETKHYFYTGIEPLANTRRPSDNNPPFYLHAFVADYDNLKMSKDQVMRAIDRLQVKPTWLEQSLGSNWRLVWELESPFLFGGDGKFCEFVLLQAEKWLNLDCLPEWDKAAFESFSRLYCNGGVWEKLPYGKVDVEASQGFLVRCAKKYGRFAATPEEENIPLEEVYEALKAKFPKFEWPGPFEVESMGPSFWVEGSTSPKSAIVKPGGMFSFAAHALRDFTPWGDPDLLGRDFVRDNKDSRIAKATVGMFMDNSDVCWKKDAASDTYTPYSPRAVTVYMKTECRLSGEKKKGEAASQVDEALSFLKEHQRVDRVAPFAGRRPGLIIQGTKKMLNIYSCKPIEPATGAQKFGPQGDFPFMSAVLEELYSPEPTQLARLLAWGSHLYSSFFHWDPRPGHTIISAGGKSTGKTLVNREFFGKLVGGFADAASWLIGGGNFTSLFLENPYLVLDDDSAVCSYETEQKLTGLVKKLVSNQAFEYSAKYIPSCMVEYIGRLGITVNLDYRSTRLVGSFDSAVLDKVMLFRCVEKMEKLKYPDRGEIERMLLRERPHFARYLLDYVAPDFVERDPENRFGFLHWHEPTLLAETHQSSRVAPFKEILIRALTNWFHENPDAAYYEGAQVDVFQLLRTLDTGTGMLRSMRETQLNANLEQVHRDKFLVSTFSTGANNIRLWRFERPKQLMAGTVIASPVQDAGAYNPFVK